MRRAMMQAAVAGAGSSSSSSSSSRLDHRRRSVLISGASIAGPALAYWLAKYGFKPVVVERAESLRPGGQGVDLEGAGQNVTRLMGLEESIRAARSEEKGVRFVDATGRVRASFPSGTGASFSKDVEILRGDLAKLIYDKTTGSSEYVFGNTIEALHDRGDKVTVSFAHGPDRDFDVVVGADGVRSRTRALILGKEAGCREEEVLRPLGVYFAFFTIPRGGRDNDWGEWCSVPGARVMFLRPDNVGTTRALFAFMSPPQGYEYMTQAQQKEAVASKFREGAGWEAPRMLEGMMASDDFYLDYLTQVHCPRWSKGNCALVGDAAYCPTGLTGMGSSVAILGAYILAGELAKHPSSTQEGLAAYERVLRPYVQKAQRLIPGTPRLAYPKTSLGVNAFYSFMSTVASSKALSEAIFGGRQVEAATPADAGPGAAVGMLTDRYGFQLPDYSAYYISAEEEATARGQ